jgi:hypothetical protein
MVMRELAQPRPTFVLERGAYDSPGAMVSRQVPEAFRYETSREADQISSDDQADKSQPQLNRLDLAKWLVNPEHPLTSRVAVNRMWQMLFGRGIVATSEDFGLQGSQPTHPQLLDWLAIEFIDSGWDVKRLLKTVVMSRTYRQSSNVSPRLLEADPENQLLARGPAVRLPAEMIRDAALAAGGILSEERGGPPVKPYQPAGLWKEKSGSVYQRDVGPGSHRRSLYTYWKRTSPPPSMMTFDASGREVCTVRRQTTLTPLQILVTLNDPQYVEAAIALAERAMRSSSELEQQLEFIFRSSVGRRPSGAEAFILRQLFQEQYEMFRASPDRAEALLDVGDHVCDPKLEQTVLASLAIVSQAGLAHDEAIMKR